MWPNELVELKHIEELLTCGICYEYIDTSMITTCSHNYCSLCIRKYLLYKQQCPICFEETFEKDLRKNQVLDKILVEYLTAKNKLKERLLLEETEPEKNNDLDVVHSLNNLECKKEAEVFSTNEASLECSNSPTSNQNVASVSTPRVKSNYQQNISSPSTSMSPKIPLMFTPKSKRSYRNDLKAIICPVCKVDVPQRNIDKHVDDCLKRQSTKDQSTKVELGRKPLPKFVLSLMKDNAIRKKLKELGLQSQGDRKTLENRLQKYIIFYNAECDKTNPRPIQELIKQFEEEENLVKRAQKTSNLNRLNINRNTAHNIIEQQRKKYLAANKGSFGELIAKIKGVNSPQKLPVRRNILNNIDINSPEKDNVNDSITVEVNEENDFAHMNSVNPYIDDSSSNTTCPLQMYSSEDPINFLTVEFSSSIDSNQNDFVFKKDAPCDIGPLSFNLPIKTENVKTELSSAHSIHEGVVSNSFNNTTNVSQTRKRSVSENDTNVRVKKSYFDLIRNESESRKVTKLYAKRSINDTKCSQGTFDTHSDSTDQLGGKGLCEIRDSTIGDVECSIVDLESSDHQLEYEKSMHEQSCKVKEEDEIIRIVFEKENVKILNNNITDDIRKREYSTTFGKNTEEKNEDKSTGRKPARFKLSRANELNHENFDESPSENEEELQNKKPRLRVTRVNSADSSAKRCTTDKSKTTKINRRKNVK